MEAFSSPDPWYLTVVRTHGVLFLRPEKSWRPIVSVTLENGQPSHELVLGCDGQNPNLKTPFVLNDVDESTRLDIRIWHKSPRMNRRKRHLVGSAYVSLGELLKRQERPGADLALRLKCPPPQKRIRNVASGRQSNAVTLTVRLGVPSALLPGSCASSSVSATLVASPPPSVYEVDDEDEDECYLSDDEESSHPLDTVPDSQTTEIVPPWQSPDTAINSSGGLHRRHRRVKAYCINSSDEEEVSVSCSSSDEQPRVFIHPVDDTEPEIFCERVLPILPQHAGYGEEGVPLSLMERILDRFAPYCEMTRRECDFGLVHRRLVAEWYTVAASLLGLAGLNAAVFGFSQGTLYEIDSLALRCVTFGSIAAAVGLVADIWFLVSYGGADPAKFEILTRDVYGSYFFFCLTCRLPTLCLFISTCALMSFLLAVAWTAWPTAVLVMSCAAGTLLTLQYLVYGCHRAVNLLIWIVQVVWRSIAGVFLRCLRRKAVVAVTVPPADLDRQPGGKGPSATTPS